MKKKYNFNGKVITLPYTYTNEVGNIVTTSSEEYIYAHGGSDYVEPVPTPKSDAELLAEAKAQKVAEIEQYDTSSEVNGFVYGGQEFWLPRETRVSLMNTANILDSETMVLWLGTFSVELPVEQVKAMLSALEKYAFACYNVTASHKAAVMALSSMTEVEGYDVTSGYPDKLEF